MKIVVTSTGDGLESPVDPRFGRAAKFILFDTESEETRAIDNQQNMSLPQGAGIQAAATVAELGSDCLITGHCGPKAYRTLKAANIQVVIGAQGTVKEVIEQFKAGKLKPTSSADVDGHW